MNTRFLDKLPDNKWFELDDIAGDPVKNRTYIYILVSKAFLAKQYIYRDGKRIPQYYLVERPKKKEKLPKRKCLQCGAMFRPTSRFNFLCGKDDVEF